MFDDWKLQDFAPSEGLAAGAQGTDFDDAAWIPVTVPGDVHRALIAAGRIADPFYDRNEDLCAWMEDREWWYRTRLPAPTEPLAPGERLRLVFHGLDTFATVWLDGQELGRHQNMFRPAVFDVTGLLRPGATHTLALCFDRPLDHLDGRDVCGWDGQDQPRVAMRKAQYGYGWDWGPRLPTIGVWRPVELRRERVACLDGVHCYTLEVDRETGQALVAVRVEAERFGASEALTARIQLASPDGAAAATAT
ncbi:MAG: glycoside hydrolase family 2 protein, partial [Chloroflexota bacterium]|nr:glycoside hydrolase family 2 protein [Chloroflexota bacterium]